MFKKEMKSQANQNDCSHRSKKRKTSVQLSNDNKSEKDKNILNFSSSAPECIADNWPSEAELNSTDNERRNSEMNGAIGEYPFNYEALYMGLVFEYLDTHDLLSASKVCTTWNTIAMDRSLWLTVRLRNSMVCNWDKCIDALNENGSVSLDMRKMLIPTKIEDFNEFWLEFTNAVRNAQTLKYLELYRCSATVVEYTTILLPELTVLNATTIKGPNISKDNPYKFMTLGLRYVEQMTNLTELKIKGLTGIKLLYLPSFESLVNLKSLSLTSIKEFPRNVCRSLETLSINLTFFEIGDCDCLSDDFSVVIKRLINLKSLRLENCYGRFENFVKEVFCSIRGLDKLKILELINIKFSNDVKYELEKCTNIKVLLIIPLYTEKICSSILDLIECLKKLKKTLTHLVWGLTHELLRTVDLFIIRHLKDIHTIGCRYKLLKKNKYMYYIPIATNRKPGEDSVIHEDNVCDKVDLLPVRDFEILLEELMINGKSKVVKIPFSETTRVYSREHFNDL